MTTEAPPAEAAPAPEPELARLATSQLKRVRRIVDAAVALAERGGYDAVRLREVSEASGVALGTLYKYFRSKEDILLHAVNEELEKLEQVGAARPPQGTTPLARVTALFGRATRGLTERSDFARAALRAVAAGGEGAPLKVAGFHLRMTRMIVAALRGEPPQPGRPISERVGSTHERKLASALEHVWFAALIGWASGLFQTDAVTVQIRDTAELLLTGADASPS